MPFDPGFFDESHWRFAIQFNDDDGAPLDLTGKEELRAVLYDRNGHEAFVWNSQDAASDEGTIDITGIATGLLVLEATLSQHADVKEGRPYSWKLYDLEDEADPAILAIGTAYIGRVGEHIPACFQFRRIDRDRRRCRHQGRPGRGRDGHAGTLGAPG
jgi:hypothetical protein